MPPGPLPSPTRRRRNAPTIPTTNLPASGRKGPAPKCPYPLGAAGADWWRWAWHTPQALAWSSGDLFALGRRAQLEDDLKALEFVGFDPPPTDDDDLWSWVKAMTDLVGRLKAITSGKLQLVREARELDDRFGLTPKGFAALRWQIVDDKAEKPPAPPATGSGSVSDLSERRRRIVDAS